MMTCDEARPLLSAYFDRELDVTKGLEIQRHLRGCDGCAAVVQQHEALRSSLSGASLSFAPPLWRVGPWIERAWPVEAPPRSKGP